MCLLPKRVVSVDVDEPDPKLECLLPQTERPKQPSPFRAFLRRLWSHDVSVRSSSESIVTFSVPASPSMLVPRPLSMPIPIRRPVQSVGTVQTVGTVKSVGTDEFDHDGYHRPSLLSAHESIMTSSMDMRCNELMHDSVIGRYLSDQRPFQLNRPLENPSLSVENVGHGYGHFHINPDRYYEHPARSARCAADNSDSLYASTSMEPAVAAGRRDAHAVQEADAADRGADGSDALQDSRLGI